MSNSVRPQRWQPTRLPGPWDSPAQLCLTFVTPWTVALQAPLFMGFSRQKHWSGLLFPPPGDLPDSGIKPASPALADGFVTAEPSGKPIDRFTCLENPRDGGAWWAAVHWVAQSRTRLKRLSSSSSRRGQEQQSRRMASGFYYRVADPTRGATSGLWATRGWRGEALWVFYPVRSPLRAPGEG